MIKILLADDERKIREGMQQIIDWEALGLKLLALAPNGVVAYELILKHQPQIVITDLKMPGLNGIELIEKVVGNKDIVTPKFIILSGYNDFDFAQQAMKFGIRHYLLKPTSEDEIIKVLKEVIWLIRSGNNPACIPEDKPDYSQTIARMIDYTEENLDNPKLLLKNIAQDVIFLNEEYLGKLFLKEVGMKYTKYVQERRVLLAKELLISNKNMSVGNVAQKVGYADNPQYFNTVFKKEVGMTPNQYRKQVNER